MPDKKKYFSFYAEPDLAAIINNEVAEMLRGMPDRSPTMSQAIRRLIMRTAAQGERPSQTRGKATEAKTPTRRRRPIQDDAIDDVGV
jgi:hypothetical protein